MTKLLLNRAGERVRRVYEHIRLTRTASCRCGQLTAACTGDPQGVSVCHCIACQQRSGSAFTAQASWPADQVSIEGRSKFWSRSADSGRTVTYHFCPDCGSTVRYTGGNFPDAIAIPVGAFADPHFPRPRRSFWEERRHAWVEILGEDVEHSAPSKSACFGLCLTRLDHRRPELC